MKSGPKKPQVVPDTGRASEDNAMLYRDLDNKVRDRTQEL
jgi:hypothetical protein